MSRNLRILAWVIVVTYGVGVVANLVSLGQGDPTYPPHLWAVFAVLKLAGFVGGLLLLRQMRLGAWLLLVSLIAGAVIALAFTGPYPVLQWLGASFLMVCVAGLAYRIIRGDWAVLRPLFLSSGG